MVARILLNSSALIILSVKNHQTSISTYSVQESKRFVQSLPERSIVTSIGEHRRCSLNTLAGEVIDKDLLRHLRALGSLGSVGATIRISDAEEALGNHVEVEIDEEVVDVLGG